MKLNSLAIGLAAMAVTWVTAAQETATPNGIADHRRDAVALTGATVYQADGSYQEDAIVLLENGQIISVSSNGQVPDGFFEIDMSGRYLYPGFLDIYTG